MQDWIQLCINIISKTVTTGAIQHKKSLKSVKKSSFEKCRSWSLDYMMQLLAQTQIYNWRMRISVSNVRLR